MNEKIIATLSAGSFASFINWADPQAQNINPVFVATFKHPKYPQPVAAYCKIYPITQGERGLINEITGYLFAHALDVPQPDNAFIAQIPVELIKKELLQKLDKSHWIFNHEMFPAFCTTRLDGKSAGIFLNAESQDIFDDIAKWPALPQTVALDENIAHTDRHINNLLRIKTNSYAAIDNGRLVCDKSERWTIDMLDHNKLYRNRLSEHIWHHLPEKKIVHSMMFCAENHAKNMIKTADELLYWVKILIKKSEEQSAFYEFLHQRTGIAPCLIQQRYQHLI